MSTIPQATIETITPEVAEQFLAKNVKNRPLKRIKIAQFARDMSNGNWQFTGEAIKFDTLGNLLDGQNRLHAIIESGATIQTLVIRGLATETQGIMDSGTPRSGADQLNLNGFERGKDLQAAANAHRAWKEGLLTNCMTGLNSTVRLTNSEILAYVQDHPELAQATQFATRFKRHLPLPIGALATAYAELVKVDADAADEFFARIQDLRSNGKGDPIGTLLKRVNEERERKRRIDVALGLYFIFRAWNAMRDGQPLGKFQIGSQDKGWVTVPEPK